MVIVDQQIVYREFTWPLPFPLLQPTGHLVQISGPNIIAKSLEDAIEYGAAKHNSFHHQYDDNPHQGFHFNDPKEFKILLQKIKPEEKNVPNDDKRLIHIYWYFHHLNKWKI